MNIYFLNDYNFINHRLTSVKNDNATTMTITYSANGNIASKTGIGAYSYSTSRPHAVVGVENISRVISSEYQSITYSPFNKVQTITQANKKLTIKYGPDKQRVKTIYANGKTTQTRIYAGDFERLSQNGSTTGYQYIYSPDGLVGIYVKPSNSNGTMHYATTDHLGSLLRLYNANGTQTFSAEYNAWGKQTATQNTLNLRRGYCLHEHWNEFGLIDMNGRFYDPQLGRFLSPDPYVQAPNNPQNFNRYSYCLNNPLKYTDPTGEYFGIDDLVAGIIGGVVNLTVNAIQGNLSGHGVWGGIGRGFAAFGAGAVGGVGALYPEFGGWAWGGATVGATNSWLGGATSASDIAMGACVGAVAGMAGGAAGQWATTATSPLLSSISSPVIRSSVSGIIGGAAGGYVGGFTGGLIMTGDFSSANKAGLSGLYTGAGIGGLAGGFAGYRYAKANDLNPWTGRVNPMEPLKPIECKSITPYEKGQQGVEMALREIKMEGGTPLQREVTLEVNGVRVRVDIAADFNGEIQLIEVKNGPHAGYTPNQKIAYPLMDDAVHIPIVPRGANASQIPQWTVGEPTVFYQLRIIRY